MPAPGDRLGPYEIIATIGRGGMGEVFRARDSRLNREVAVKTSATQFSERFEREARAIASLNHPNICTLFDVGPNYLVMELVEGEPLKGPYPLDKAVAYAKQIASALEAAHEKQITHRDLKPGNILLTQDGVVKVLDFGLAKIGEPTRSESNLENSPTMTLGATVAGTILGTAAYMAPEQARGKVVDKRADIWAFGVVLFEILTGDRLFKGDDLTETLAAVVMKEPEFEKVPYEVRRLLKKCLQKDPKNRLRDIGDVWELLDGAEPAPVVQNQSASKLPWAAAGVATLGLLGAGGWIYTRPAPAPDAQVMRFTIPPPADAVLTARNIGSTQQALSPDGRYIVFVADSAKDGGPRQVLWVRPIDSEKAQPLSGTEGAFQPFWSPDSKHIAYFADDKLKRVPSTGGSPLNLADVLNSSGAQGGSWFQDGSAEGVILFAPTNSAIFRVSATGGLPAEVTKFADGEIGHMNPQILPDGKRFLYLARGDKPGIFVQQLGSQERTRLLDIANRAVFAPPDLLLYLRENSLLAQRWDWSSLKPLGEPLQIADQVRSGGANGRSSFSVSATGALVYREGASAGLARYQWFPLDGPGQEFATPQRDFQDIELSPDRRKGLFRTVRDLFLVDLSSGVISALTNDEGADRDPVWSPDGRRIAFVKSDGLYQMVMGSGTAIKLTSKQQLRLEAWLPDGILAYDARKLVLLPAPAENATSLSDQNPRVLAELDCDQVRVSPDGKTVAYVPLDQTIPEVWVASFPAMTDRRKVGDGNAPLWRPDGRELFFLDNNVIKSTDVTPGANPTFGPPRTVINVPTVAIASTTIHQYAISADGKRLLVRVQDVQLSDAESLHVVLNWPSLVK